MGRSALDDRGEHRAECVVTSPTWRKARRAVEDARTCERYALDALAFADEETTTAPCRAFSVTEARKDAADAADYWVRALVALVSL